jgi:uncharacterized protein YciI
MKFLKNAIIAAIAIGAFAISGYGQTTPPPTPAPSPQYDADLAKRLGADQYGMKMYVFVILKRGKVRITDPKEREALLAGHMRNIGRLADERKLVLAGPFETDQDMRGIFIFDVPTVEEARKLVETDPSIKAGMFDVEMIPWYGSAALLELNQIHKRIQKQSVTN